MSIYTPFLIYIYKHIHDMYCIKFSFPLFLGQNFAASWKKNVTYLRNKIKIHHINSTRTILLRICHYAEYTFLAFQTAVQQHRINARILVRKQAMTHGVERKSRSYARGRGDNIHLLRLARQDESARLWQTIRFIS